MLKWLQWGKQCRPAAILELVWRISQSRQASFLLSIGFDSVQETYLYQGQLVRHYGHSVMVTGGWAIGCLSPNPIDHHCNILCVHILLVLLTALSKLTLTMFVDNVDIESSSVQCSGRWQSVTSREKGKSRICPNIKMCNSVKAVCSLNTEYE